MFGLTDVNVRAVLRQAASLLAEGLPQSDTFRPTSSMSSSSSRPYTPNQNAHPAYDRNSRSSFDREAAHYRPSPLASTFRRQGSIRLRDDPASSAVAGAAAGSGTGSYNEDDEDDETWLTKPWAHFSYSEIAARSWREMVFFPEYLYPAQNRKPVSAARRRRLLFSYAPGGSGSLCLLRSLLDCPDASSAPPRAPALTPPPAVASPPHAYRLGHHDSALDRMLPP